jgi:hypothetical protein
LFKWYPLNDDIDDNDDNDDDDGDDGMNASVATNAIINTNTTCIISYLTL